MLGEALLGLPMKDSSQILRLFQTTSAQFQHAGDHLHHSLLLPPRLPACCKGIGGMVVMVLV